jgi:predicted KAP-like P-loop ATPase
LDNVTPGSLLRPGTARKELVNDKLGRDKWVKNLADLITAYPGGDSLTIALYGQWGSGKTTLLNFVIEALQQPGHQNIVVGRFNPWNFSQQDRLYSAFFATISRLLKKADKSKRARRVSTALDALSLATAPAALANFGFISSGVKTLSDMTKEYADSLGDIERVKDDISETLKRLQKRLVIVIDDIDRLTEGEVRQVFQLVKSVADFENVVYLLAFDHNMVAKALDEITGNEGHAFLEKITNVVLRVPPLTRRQVRQLLLADLEGYADRQRPYNWDTERLRRVLEVAFKGFRTLRQMERFANVLTATEGLTATDFDFTDHVALSMLQTLEPKLFDFVGSHPELFVDDIENRLGRRDEQDKLEKETITTGLSALRNLTEEDARELLGAVFPKVGRIYSRYRSEASWGKAEWRTQGRACASFTTFSRYFVFSVDESELSAADKDALWNAARAVDDLEAYLQGLTSEKLFSVYEFLTDIDAAVIDAELLRNIITATIDIGDEFAVLSGLDDMFRGPMLQAERALNVLLRALPENARFELVLDVFRRPPKSMQVPSEVAFVLGKVKEGLFTDSQTRELQRVCRDLYEASWERGEFVKHPRFLGMLPDWLGRDEPKTDAADKIRASLEHDDTKFLELLGRYENVQFDRFEPDRFNTKYLTEIYTLEEMQTRLENIRANPADEAQRQRVEELIEELQRQLDGRDAEPEPFSPVPPQTTSAPDDLPIEE